MVWALLILFQIKHFLADYPLQRGWMLNKFKPGWDFVLPLAAHCSVHAALTFLIVVCFKGVSFAACVAVLDFIIHFAMDRLKAGPKYLGRYKALTGAQFATATVEQKRGNTLFWTSLGLDQAVHHLTHYLIIYLVLA